jgi:hypothetical protein
LSIEVLEVVFLKLVEDPLNLYLLLLGLDLRGAKVAGRAGGVRVDPEDRQVLVLDDAAGSEVGAVAACTGPEGGAYLVR